MQSKLDLLRIATQKGIVKQFQNGESVYISCPIFKFNDYKKKQQRSLLVTNFAIYNLKQKTIKRKIQIQKIKAIIVSKIGTQFIIHVPSEYDYRYASSDRREQIIYYVLKAYRKVKNDKLPIYYKDQLSLVHFATTKEQKKKDGPKEVKGEYIMYDDVTYEKYLQGEQKQRQMVRRITKTLFSQEILKEQVTLEDFTPKIVLGKGAFGTVFLVERKKTKQLFAMKSINKDDIVKKDQIEHTKTQKMILEHVNHPFLVNLAYAFQTPTKLYFIMQFMRGGELFQHLSNAKRFPQKQAKFYAAQIALGLGHLHSKDFIYRDLKLQNVLMDDYGNASLTDFGMARVIREGELANTFCGTPQYLAPEVLAGGGYDKLADWWSLGILIYEMMFGLPPFYNKSQSTMFKLIKQGEVKFSQKVTLSLEGKDFILKILNKNPKDRLGCKKDAEDLFDHPWLKSIDRQKLLRKQLPTPFKPKIEGEDWISGFDKQFTSEKAFYDQRQDAKESEQYKQIFNQF